jgi:16S rRNA (cytosine967-C5)-methyltransferase
MDVDRGDHAEDALARLAPGHPSDRGLAWFLLLGVLRHRAHVDASLRPHLNRPLDSLDPAVRAVLRLGAFEKLYARAPAHAVVHQAVEVASAVGVGRAKGLVNAIMRRVEPAADLSLAEELDHPAWLVHRWVERYGRAATEAWCRKNNEPPTLSIVVRDDRLAADLSAAGLTVAAVRLGDRTLPGMLRVSGHEGAVPTLPGFKEGRFWVQDAASVAVADLVGEVDGLGVLDACAAPGGKSFRLASRGARVTAVDYAQSRITLLRESAKRLALPLEVVDHDWLEGSAREFPGDRTWPAVLVDAPCTALGTVRRHPEVRWRRQPGDLETVTERQFGILSSVSRAVAQRGVLVYAVCSPEPEEGQKVARRFAEASGFTIEEELSTALPDVGLDAEADAFYGARLRSP